MKLRENKFFGATERSSTVDCRTSKALKFEIWASSNPAFSPLLAAYWLPSFLFYGYFFYTYIRWKEKGIELADGIKLQKIIACIPLLGE